MSAPALVSLSDALTRLKAEPELFVVYDRNAAWVAQELIPALPVKASLEIETSEQGKTLDSVLTLERWLLKADASRKALVVGIGGGITTDLVGFTAAIYKRGVRYANVPTTLLGQVDAAIGGKTGVNLDGYKNMLGAFRMPEFTVLEASFLRTLPAREWRCGMAELVKTFLLADGAAYEKAVRCFASAQHDNLQPLILQAAQIKARIVAEDPEEHGVRAKLNLGHTFGHAIEHEAHLRGDDVAHGEAVAMGMILAAQLSERLGVAEKGLADALRADFIRIGLPVDSPYPADTLVEAVAKDKKAAGGKVRFVLLQAPGHVILKDLDLNDLHIDTK